MKRAMENIPSPRHPSKHWKNWARALAGIGAGLALTLAACGSSKESKATAAASSAVIEQKPDARPALWQVKDADTTIYLFGTVHMLKPEISWFDGAIQSAFDSSDELVMEVVEPDQAEMSSIVTTLALNPNGPSITSQLSPKEKEAYLKALADNNLPVAAMDQLDPWMVAITLSIAPLKRMGYDSDSGVEKALEKAALAKGKTVTGLETARQQLGYFDSLPQPVQLAYLNSTVAELSTMEGEFNQLLNNWANGNPDALAQQMNASLETTPELAQALLFDRNARWVDWIGKRLEKPGTVFLAVGAGHLSGKGSVIDLLQRKGMVVTRITTGKSAPK